jgi:hypothetical protein
MAFLKQPKVTYRTEKDIEDLKSKNDLLYVINGEIDQDKFILLAESTKTGSLNICLPSLSLTKTFELKPLTATRIEIPIKDLKACTDLEYEFKFIPSEGNTIDDASTNYSSGRFTVPPKAGESCVITENHYSCNTTSFKSCLLINNRNSTHMNII